MEIAFKYLTNDFGYYSGIEAIIFKKKINHSFNTSLAGFQQ